jgi:hypothetical protein
MLFTFHIVAALPLHARGQRHDSQPCSQLDHLEGPFEDTSDQQHDHGIDHQIDREPDEPPPSPGTDQPPPQPTIAQPSEVIIIESFNSYV